MEYTSSHFEAKVAELESQLREYELEQARLKNTENNNAENNLESHNIPLNSKNNMFPASNRNALLSSYYYEDGYEQRKERNCALLSKLKDLEKNSALFAARAEKLRLMKVGTFCSLSIYHTIL